MIPKIIHYCWFGRNPKSENVLRYIKTWKEKMPDYEIKEWNEDNFDVNYNDFTKEAYYAKKYAFVSDVARLYALVKEGGIYLDTDIIVLKRFPDEFLSYKGFAGFEHERYIGTGIMACERDNEVIRAFLESYSSRHFFRGIRFCMMPNVRYFTELLKAKGLLCNNTLQEIDGFKLFPQDVFCCKDCRTMELYNNENSLSVHDFAGLWLDKRIGLWSKVGKRLHELKVVAGYFISGKNEG